MSSARGGATMRLAAVTAMLVALSAWTYARPHAAVDNPPDFETMVPLAFAEWAGEAAPPLDPDVARVLNADQYVHRYYDPRTNGAASSIEMDIAYYARPQAGAAMHSPLSCLPGNGWQVIESRFVPVPAEGADVAVRRLVVARGEYRVAMTYWFQNRGAVVGNEYRQRFQLLSNGLRGRPTDAALVRVMAPDTPEGHATLNRFTRELVTMLRDGFR